MRLSDYIQELEGLGRLWFTKSEASARLDCTKDALKQAIYILIQKGRLAPIRGDFVLIVPFSYKTWGILPANYFIEPLMKYLGLPYYISTLSAAQYYGAAHQKPQQFQVVTNHSIKNLIYARINIRFLQSNKIALVPTQRVQTATGYALVSTPEATAFDLCKYYKASGYWNNIATVILELLEAIDIDKLCKLANNGIFDTSVIQRLGFVLAHPDVNGATAAEKLYKTVSPKSFRWVPLNPQQKYIAELGPWKKDDKWKILINEEIDTDIDH
jgi:predicted transcriptional regulator of viral defense system